MTDDNDHDAAAAKEQRCARFPRHEALSDGSPVIRMLDLHEIARRAGAQMGIAPEEAIAHMDSWDRLHMREFSGGNSDRGTLH